MPLKYALIFIVHKIYHIEARACLVRCDESMSNVSHTSSEIGWMLYNTRFVWMNVYESNCIYSPNCEIYNNYILICVRHSVQWQWRYGKMFSNTASDRTSKCSSFEQTVWNDQSNRLCLSFTLRLPLLKNAFRVPIKCNCAESWEPIVQRRAVLCCTAYVFEAKRIRSSCSSCIEGECNARLVDNQFDVGREEEKKYRPNEKSINRLMCGFVGATTTQMKRAHSPVLEWRATTERETWRQKIIRDDLLFFWFSHVRSAAINSNYHYTTHWSALVDRTTIVGPNANVFWNRKSSASIQFSVCTTTTKVKKNAETKLKMKYTNSILSCCLLFIFGLFWCCEISGEKTA